MRKGLRLIVLVIPLAVTSGLLATLVWLISAGSAQAASCDVPSGTHPTIQSAVDDAGCDTVNLTDALYIENVIITRSVAIHGQGALTTTVDGNASDSVFTIQPGLAVTLTDLTMTNGNALYGGGINHAGDRLTVINGILDGNSAKYGGGIYNNQGILYVANSTLSGNLATGPSVPSGGGIYNQFGLVQVTNSTLISNSSGNEGGGIYNIGKLTVTNSTLSHNSASFGGGILNAYYLLQTEVTLASTTLSDNSASLEGGGIHNQGRVQVISSTLSRNSAGQEGGGIYNLFYLVQVINSTLISNTANVGGGIGVGGMGTLTVTSSTLTRNSADSGGGISNGGAATVTNSTLSGNSAVQFGGGIYNRDTVQVINSTLSGNSADNVGGGIDSTFGTVNLANSIVAHSPKGGDCSGTITSLGYNLSSDNSCSLTAAGDITNTIPLLGPLQDNGGPTMTHALLPDSPAIDAADDAACPPTDQRGVSRPIDGDGDGLARCDIGAYEYDGPPPPRYVYLPLILSP